MSYSWFRVDNQIDSHPKVLAFEKAIGDPNGLAYLTRLHCWTHRYATSGTFSKTLSDQVEAHCKWRGEPGLLVKTFVKFGLIEDSRRTLEVHDWEDFQGKLVEKSKRDAELKRKKREERRADGADAARAGRARGARTAPPAVGTLPNETGRDVTRRSLDEPQTDFGSDQPDRGANRGEKNWGAKAEKLVAWMRSQRAVAGNFPADRDADLAAIHSWALGWFLKHEPDERAVDLMCSAFNGYLTDPWAIARDCTLALWCGDNVGLHRWTEERAKAAA